ncbi:class I SAM-dependent methyltransferase [Rhizobium helianthi]|uniref:Class I SAM-dependent methyltransferase n=1 Tax=Rhizobium helianthi TaxID=1132695 RepID=A0ABW4M322_9HYPH
MDKADRKFIFQSLSTIEGYIDPPDALVFQALLHCQQQRQMAGALAEIGVFYGRSYFLMKQLSKGHSPILAIDLFDLDEDRAGEPQQYQRFLDNGRQLGLPVDETNVIRGDSCSLTPDAILSRVGPVRFFSIDGGHHLHHVASDAALALECIAPHGIIVFDDTFNIAWPEVTVGVADFLRQHADTLCCFCVTKYKTYVCHRSWRDFYVETIRQAKQLSALERSEIEFLGSSIIKLHTPLGRRVMFEIMRRSGLGSLSGRAFR